MVGLGPAVWGWGGATAHRALCRTAGQAAALRLARADPGAGPAVDGDRGRGRAGGGRGHRRRGRRARGARAPLHLVRWCWGMRLMAMCGSEPQCDARHPDLAPQLGPRRVCDPRRRVRRCRVPRGRPRAAPGAGVAVDHGGGRVARHQSLRGRRARAARGGVHALRSRGRRRARGGSVWGGSGVSVAREGGSAVVARPLSPPSPPRHAAAVSNRGVGSPGTGAATPSGGASSVTRTHCGPAQPTQRAT